MRSRTTRPQNLNLFFPTLRSPLGLSMLFFIAMLTRGTAQSGSLLQTEARRPALASNPSGMDQGPQRQAQLQQIPNQTVPLDPVQPPLPPRPGEELSPIALSGASWTYQPAPPMRVFRINDMVQIRVDEITRMAAEGAAIQQKRTLYETILTDWVRLTDFRLRPDAQPNGDPAIGSESTANYRAQSNLQSRESMAFNIAATIVDIRPNGNLVLEARKMIRVNDNLWETALTGMCRAEDIAPDNVVLSKDLIDLEINKQDRGHLRDGYRRGWLLRFLNEIQLF